MFAKNAMLSEAPATVVKFVINEAAKALKGELLSAQQNGFDERVIGMKFGRRAFLQFTAGVVGGTLLSPMPWKLADDSAIWSQNWSWRPSPERGHITKKKTICLLCDGGCGIQARLVEEHRAILIEGNPEHPINEGGICPLGSAGLQFLYAPYRISKPMKQTGKRGDAKGFQPITWAEALNELSTKLSKLRSEGKAAGVACITAQRSSSMDDLWRQFLTAYGSPNFLKMVSHGDSLSLAAALATGQQAPLAFAIERASYVLSFGADLIDGWSAPCRMQAAYRNWHQESSGKGSARIVQIESRCSMTATKADRWIPIAPGSEAALALAVAHVLIKENLYDTGFIENNSFGFEDWTDAQGKTRQGFKSFVLAAYAPEQIAELTGVAAATIREIAKEFASEKDGVAVWGENQGDIPENIYHDLAFLALNALKGNLKPEGMVSLVPAVPLAPLPALEQAPSKKRLDLAQAKTVPLPGNGLHAFLDTLNNNPAYGIDVLMVHEANPAYSLPESQLFQEAAKRVGMLVSFSSYMDETALQADLILPNHCAFERLDDVIGLPSTPYGYYAVASPILPPQLETKHTGDVILELGKAVSGDIATALPWKTYEAYLQERVNGLAASGKGAVADRRDIGLEALKAGQSPSPNYKDGPDLWKKLTGGSCWYDAPVDMTRGFQTVSGKFEFACRMLLEKGLTEAEDLVYLPHYAPLVPSGSDKDYPLLLVSFQMLSLANDYLANPPFMTKTLWDFVLKGNDLFAQLHPQTAKSLGMREGDKAVLKTSQGEVPVRVHLFPGARAGVVYVPQGLGHKAYDAYIQDKGINANNVVEVQMDPVTGLGTVWTTRAQLRRV
jgi:anaerobic selenocysteine-containing dehydrogenase